MRLLVTAQGRREKRSRAELQEEDAYARLEHPQDLEKLGDEVIVSLLGWSLFQ